MPVEHVVRVVHVGPAVVARGHAIGKLIPGWTPEDVPFFELDVGNDTDFGPTCRDHIQNARRLRVAGLAPEKHERFSAQSRKIDIRTFW